MPHLARECSASDSSEIFSNESYILSLCVRRLDKRPMKLTQNSSKYSAVQSFFCKRLQFAAQLAEKFSGYVSHWFTEARPRNESKRRPEKNLKLSRTSILKLCNKMYILELCVSCVDACYGCTEDLISRH